MFKYLSNVFFTAGPFTLFAPTDDAFRALPAGALDSLIANPEELKKVLLSHVVPGTTYSRGLTTGKLNLARGGTADVTVNQSKPFISASAEVRILLTQFHF